MNLIVLTHTHFDHAGGAKRIKELTKAPIAVHRSEALFLRRGRTPVPDGTRWKGKVLAALGRTFGRRLTRYPGVEPDLLVDEELSLADYGISGNVIQPVILQALFPCCLNRARRWWVTMYLGYHPKAIIRLSRMTGKGC